MADAGLDPVLKPWSASFTPTDPDAHAAQFDRLWGIARRKARSTGYTAVLTHMEGEALPIGSRIRMSYQTNAQRVVVTSRISATETGLTCFARPSRGYAKHVRKQKGRKS